MNVYLGVKSVSCSINTGESEIPELRGEPFETIEIVSTTGGTVLINLHTVEQATKLLCAATLALGRIQGRASTQHWPPAAE